MFLAPWFILGGLAAAAGPVIIHLMHRRRYKVVHWAAMEFLMQAVRRNRRMFEIRDVLLMLLRMACLLLFAVGMARPYFAGNGVTSYTPVHAVLVVDNSLSMEYTVLDRSLLDEARRRAEELIDTLPRGSRVTVLPTCRGDAPRWQVAYRNPEEARGALEAIGIVDRRADLASALAAAGEAARDLSEPATKRIVVFSDQQAINFPDRPPDALDLPCPVEFVSVPPSAVENAAVVRLASQDAVVTRGTPTVFVATISFQGPSLRNGVQVALAVDGSIAATRTVDLAPGEIREVEFPPVLLDAPAAEDGVGFAAVEVSLPPDNLAGDDVFTRMVPVLDRLPVVFVDQLGQAEDPAGNRYGETYRLRRLLAAAEGSTAASGNAIRHASINDLSRELLADARLVVLAGVRSPGEAAPLLREYVEQGGRLLLAAGGEFDPLPWNDLAWAEGEGVLPAPLKLVCVGEIPQQAQGDLEPFQIDFATCTGDSFFLEGVARSELEELYRQAWFFKAVEVDEQAAETALAPSGEAATGKANTPAEATSIDTSEGPDGRVPRWLTWGNSWQHAAELPRGSGTCNVLARFNNGVPFVVDRRIGRGRVVFVSSGVFRDWNTMTASAAVLYYDRLMRDLLYETLPHRNLGTGETFSLVLPDAYRDARCRMIDTQGDAHSIPIGAFDATRWGVFIDGFPRRGEYRVLLETTAGEVGVSGGSGEPTRRRGLRLAAFGPAEESQLEYADQETIARLMGKKETTLDSQAAAIGGLGRNGSEWWRWFVLAALFGLLLEMAFLAPRRREVPAP